MEKILHIETATDMCSVALSEGEEIIAIRETSFGKSHAGVLTVFIQELLDETKTSSDLLDAVAVSMGPGSYTGLRIGVSVAKGLSYGLDIPLIAVPTLQAMFCGMKNAYLAGNPDSVVPDYYIPMIDARRLEVYLAIYNKNEIQEEDIQAFIVYPDSFSSYFQKGKVCFFGSGSLKLKDLLIDRNAIFPDSFIHSARNMVKLASDRFRNDVFEDVAYFEPFYLKEFITTVPKKNVLNRLENRA